MIESSRNGDAAATETIGTKTPQVVEAAFADEIGGCGGFGKGNFSELFKSIEVYESDLGIN
jgi:4-hydroxyphenylpyruvate dioxygenase-like putative hemolysin